MAFFKDVYDDVIGGFIKDGIKSVFKGRGKGGGTPPPDPASNPKIDRLEDKILKITLALAKKGLSEKQEEILQGQLQKAEGELEKEIEKAEAEEAEAEERKKFSLVFKAGIPLSILLVLTPWVYLWHVGAMWAVILVIAPFLKEGGKKVKK